MDSQYILNVGSTEFYGGLDVRFARNNSKDFGRWVKLLSTKMRSLWVDLVCGGWVGGGDWNQECNVEYIQFEMHIKQPAGDPEVIVVCSSVEFGRKVLIYSDYIISLGTC